MNPKLFLAHCKSDLEAMLRCLRSAVEMESPSDSKHHVDRLARFFAEQFRRCHGKVRLLEHRTAGSAVLAEFWGRDQRSGPALKPILLLGHLDTVWEAGTLARMPFRIRGGRAYGPGILDMKAGIVCALWAVRALQAQRIQPQSPVRIFLNSDEEVSSVAFRNQILAEARRARAVLVLEPAAAGGALKTSRKGVGEFRITVHGKAAHAGINPAAGVNAINELALVLLRIDCLAQPIAGLTLNAGVIEGGTRANVVPERASARIDVRVQRPSDGEMIEQTLRALKPLHREARIEIEGHINRPPMERRHARQLFEMAGRVGRKMGLELTEASTGGASDGNLTAALGIPTLDGLGAIGDGAHARHEHVVIRELPRRAALLAALLVKAGEKERKRSTAVAAAPHPAAQEEAVPFL